MSKNGSKTERKKGDNGLRILRTLHRVRFACGIFEFRGIPRPVGSFPEMSDSSNVSRRDVSRKIERV